MLIFNWKLSVEGTLCSYRIFSKLYRGDFYFYFQLLFNSKSNINQKSPMFSST